MEDRAQIMAIHDYIKFNIKQYIEDYYYYKKILPDLIREYENLDGITAVQIQTDKVQTSPNADGMEKIALERAVLSDRIEKYQKHIKQCEKALQNLTDTEREVIELSHVGKSYPFMDKGYSEATFYRIKSAALNKLSLALIGI